MTASKEPNPEERARLVKKITDPLKPHEPSNEEKLYMRLREAQLRIYGHLHAIATAKGYIEGGPLTEQAVRYFMNEFHQYSREELTALLATANGIDIVERLKL